MITVQVIVDFQNLKFFKHMLHLSMMNILGTSGLISKELALDIYVIQYRSTF